MNESKKRDIRFWRRWLASGAVKSELVYVNPLSPRNPMKFYRVAYSKELGQIISHANGTTTLTDISGETRELGYYQSLGPASRVAVCGACGNPVSRTALFCETHQYAWPKEWAVPSGFHIPEGLPKRWHHIVRDFESAEAKDAFNRWAEDPMGYALS